jgi:hypothetical protein
MISHSLMSHFVNTTSSDAAQLLSGGGVYAGGEGASV